MRLRLLTLALLVAAAACSPASTPSGPGSPSPSRIPATPSPEESATRSPTSSTDDSPSPSPSRSRAPGDAVLGFIVVGDFGSADAEESSVARAARAWADDHAFDALVTTGDNVYESGAPSEIDGAWAPWRWVDRAGVPRVVSLGNHDELTAQGRPEIDFFGLPGRYYERRVGPVDFFVLDSNHVEDAAQRDWLRAELAASTARWKVVVFHHPAYSCGFHASESAIHESWVPLFERFGVQLVLNGHDHNYQRFGPLDGVTYVVDGIGGDALYPVDGCPEGTPAPAEFDDAHHGFLFLRVTRGSVRGEVVAEDGTVLDRFGV